MGFTAEANGRSDRHHEMPPRYPVYNPLPPNPSLNPLFLLLFMDLTVGNLDGGPGLLRCSSYEILKDQNQKHTLRLKLLCFGPTLILPAKPRLTSLPKPSGLLLRSFSWMDRAVGGWTADDFGPDSTSRPRCSFLIFSKLLSSGPDYFLGLGL